MEFKFSAELVNAIVAYLGTRPYADVFQMVAKLDEELKAQGNGGIIKHTPKEETATSDQAVTPEVVDEEAKTETAV